jgi:hypothetical protein
MRLSFCEEDFVVTGYAGEFVNAISSVAYGNIWSPMAIFCTTNATCNSLARHPRSPPASEGLLRRCEDPVLWPGVGRRLLGAFPYALEIPRPDV